jgi:hypothetical protein
MKKLILAALIATAGPLWAEQSPAFELKHKSSFEMGSEDRNPFWPIGFKLSAKAGVTDRGPAIPTSSFVVSSITLGGGTRFAIINGKAMTEGQRFGLQLGGQIYEVTVKSIQDGRVLLVQRDQEIAVPLRRK